MKLTAFWISRTSRTTSADRPPKGPRRLGGAGPFVGRTLSRSVVTAYTTATLTVFVERIFLSPLMPVAAMGVNVPRNRGLLDASTFLFSALVSPLPCRLDAFPTTTLSFVFVDVVFGEFVTVRAVRASGSLAINASLKDFGFTAGKIDRTRNFF